MSIKKNNTYFQENDGKVYYYDENGVRKEIPASAFSDLQEQIDSLGKPLTYSGDISVTEANELTEIKQGTVYTVTGVSGTLTAGDVEVKQGDEIAWADPKWVEIGKDIDNSWKQWSEDNGCTGTNSGIYIGKNNSADYGGVAIGAANSAKYGAITIGERNIGVQTDKIFGTDNSANGTDNIFGSYNNVNGHVNTIAGDYNEISGNANTIVGRSNSAIEQSNKILGEENIVTTNSNTVIGDNNKISGLSYATSNTILGKSNTASGKAHNVFLIGEDNITPEMQGAGHSYVYGYENSAGDDVALIGTANSSQAGGFYKAAFGWENKVGNSNNIVVGGNNSATQKEGKVATVVGNYNESSGGFAFGERNKVYAESYAFGYKNSAMGGSTTFGKYNTGDLGARVFGDTNSANYGAAIFGNWGNTASYGAIVVGWSNYASYGGGAFGNGNYAGKGGWAIGESNRPYKYNSDTSSYESVNTDEGPNFPSQYAFGYSNAVYYDKNKTNAIGLPVQIGYGNKTYHFLDYNGTTYYNGAGYQPLCIYNIGFSNSAVSNGINLGAGNIILTGDGSVAASINIGKNLVNRYGVLIGQSISSFGYGIGIGDNINGVNSGDTIIGTTIITDSGSNGELSWRSSSRSIFGRYLQGYFTSDASVFGSYISAFSGTIPNRTNWYTYGIGSDALVIGSHIKGSVADGSILIGNASTDAAYANQYSNSIVPVVVTGDSMVFGGYTHDYNQSAYYRNPGISASYNGIILGQGQQMSATNDSIIVGNQSISQYGSKVFGSHGYAENASMVLNPSPMTFQSVSVSVLNINNRVLTAAPEIYGSNTAQGIYCKESFEGGYITKKFTPSGETLRKRIGNYTYYLSFFNRTNATNENLSYFAFNLPRNNVWNYDQIRGYWNNDYTQFTPDVSYGYNAREIRWTKGAFLLLRENGVNTLYEYNESTSGNGKFPKYARNSNYWYYYARYDNETGAGKTNPPNVLSDSIISDGTYIYHIPVWRNGNGGRGWSNISSNIPTSFSGSYCFEASAAYFNSDNTIDLNVPQNITSYGFNGQSGQIGSTWSSVYPSAIFTEISSMITNTTAKYGSIAIGQKNSAYGGSIAINTQDQDKNNNNSIAAHYIKYTNTKDSNVYVYKLDENGNVSSNSVNLPLYQSAGFDLSGDADNIAEGASIAIGVGNYNRNYIQYASFGLGKNVSANGDGYVIGENLTAYGKAMAIGFNASAGSNSLAINANTSYGGATAYGGSTAIGAQATAYDNSFCFNIPCMNNNSYNGGYADDGGFAMGQGCTAFDDGYSFGGKQYATRHSIAIGMKGGYGPFGNRESFDGNYAEDISLAIGFNNYAYKNSWAIGFNNNVKEFGWTYGFNNYMWGFGMALGFGNCDWIASGGTDYSKEYESVDFFGRWNKVVGSNYGLTGKGKSLTYETTMIGNNNQIVVTNTNYITGETAIFYDFAGILLGKQNECYRQNPGGYNIYLGSNNKGSQEAINIGTNNDTMGHSISLGWNNRAVKGGYEHSILIGNGNTAKNTQGYIYNKSYPVILQTILTDEQIRQINADITSLTAQCETAYANSAAKRMVLYNLLTANGMDAVSAENYLNGAIYNSGNGQSYVYPKNPWTIESYPYGYDYIDGGNLTTGYGESGFVRAWICNTSSYSSNSTSNDNYKYYWLPAKQASAIWSQVSSIYKNEFGSNSGNRYNELNDSIAIINNIQSQIYSKQNELTKNPITGTSSTDTHNIETMSFVVGQGNSADHHNSIVIGSENHTLKQVDGYYSDDDGFTVAIGLGNTVVRNYDMAIGYGSVASGGENIVIGVPYEFNDGYYSDDDGFTAYASAVGVRNIAINSDVTGMDNIAIKSYISGNGISADNDYHTNFNRNILFDSIPIIIGSGGNTAYAINNNIFNDVRGTVISTPNVFDRNDLSVLHHGVIQSNTACDNRYREVLSSIIITNQDCYNTYENVISTNLNITGLCNSYNVYKNVTNANISATSTFGSNLFYDVGGYSTGHFNGIYFTADGNTFAHNIIINAGLYGTSNYWTGITNNFFWKSYINPFNTDSKVHSYGDSFTENMLIGTEAYQSVNESFSFAAHDTSPVGWTNKGSDGPRAAVLKDVVRGWNFGDNSIQHAYDTFVAGLGNEIYGADRFTVMGGNNFVQLLTTENYKSIQENLFHDSIVLGNVNVIASNTSSYTGYKNTRNYLIGQGNTILVASGVNNQDYNTDLRIFGDINHFAGVPARTINSVLNSSSGGSLYSYTIKYQDRSYIYRYASILPVDKERFNDGYEAFSSYSSYPISGAARNTIIGSKSVISNNITDSISLGSYNAIYQDNQPHDEKFSDINLIGAYNLGINGSHQFNVGFNNITSGHHSTAIGEELRANAFQTILGKYNTSAEGTTRTTMRWNSATNTVEQVENTGVLLAVGNGRLNLYEKWTVSGYDSAYFWYDENNNIVNEKYITTDNYIQRSNAMIVSADGTVSATKFATPEIPDIGGSLNNLSELITLLQNKPSTGRHIIGVDNGTLTWLEINQN